MCLIVFSVNRNSDHPLVVAANRDEFYNRPTEPARFRGGKFNILSGLDLKEGGTWMGVRNDGRFAALTNYREGGKNDKNKRSRGHIVNDFLHSEENSSTFLENLDKERDMYNGFNLIAGDKSRLFYYSNRKGEPEELEDGIYGLSNALLNTPWPKVNLIKAKFTALSESERSDPEKIFSVLRDQRKAPAESLPYTGVARIWERLLSPVFISSPIYGTRSSTLIVFNKEGAADFYEQNYYHGKIKEPFKKFRI